MVKNDITERRKEQLDVTIEHLHMIFTSVITLFWQFMQFEISDNVDERLPSTKPLGLL